MKIQDAAKLSEKSEEVKGLRKKGCFLNSAIAFLEPAEKKIKVWNLLYYCQQDNQVTQMVVDEDNTFVKEKGTPVNPTTEPLDLKEIKTNSEKMLEKANKEFAKYKQPLSQIIVSVLKEGDRTVWKINYITKMLFLITISLDAKTGELLSSVMNSLAK